MDEAVNFLSKIRRLSALDTYLSSFVDGIKTYLKPDGKLHVRLTQHMTATGRFSGRDPNMQNMPRGGTFPVKKVFVSRWNDGKIMEADFAQLEFRVAGFLSQDEVAIKEVTEGFDVHSYTAEVISQAGQTISRQEAKAHTFAPLYGATGFGRTSAEAKYYEQFTDKYRGIGRWHERLATEVLSHRKITTPSGRQFAFPNVKRRKNGTITDFTAVKNYPVQSFATADIVPAVLIEIFNRLSNMKSMLVNSVHDSVVIDVHPEEETQVVSLIDDINRELKSLIDTKFKINFNVPLLLEAKIGVNWLDQQEVSK
jgi:DNA polymerase I-like protein with 3'-5' exonuclease and polymerase domains